jgi:hypothetical protein
MREFVTAVAAAEENEDERKESGWVELEVIEQDQHG